MRVLITNASLGYAGGTQTYVRDLAVWLLERGHSPVVFSLDLGDSAAQLRQKTIPVTDDLSTIGTAPDVIHGNSSIETMIALLHFPDAPAIFVCHGWSGFISAPPKFPRILQYVAVDDTCGDRLLLEEGIEAEKLSVLLNAVDLNRFPRRGPLPPSPKRALVFGNTAHELTHLAMVREACEKAGIDVDVVGLLSGNYVSEPEAILNQYDLVFAKAKCALEAMAAGAAVIVCDAAGISGMVRSSDAARLQRLNFGHRTLTTPLSVEAFSREIAAFNAADAEKVTELIRQTASTDILNEALFALYEKVIEEHAQRAPENESRATADFITRMALHGRKSEETRNLTLRATERVFAMPLVGQLLRKAANWLIRRGQRS